MLADLLRFVKCIMLIFGLILLKPSKSYIFCDEYCQASIDHSMLSDYPIHKFKVAFCSVSIYTHMGWYRIVFNGG